MWFCDGRHGCVTRHGGRVLEHVVLEDVKRLIRGRETRVLGHSGQVGTEESIRGGRQGSFSRVLDGCSVAKLAQASVTLEKGSASLGDGEQIRRDCDCWAGAIGWASADVDGMGRECMKGKEAKRRKGSRLTWTQRVIR